MRLPSLLKNIFDADSRKVLFGWWVFIISNWFLVIGKIDVNTWQTCALLAWSMVGGGTIADKWLEGKNGKSNDSMAGSGLGAIGGPGGNASSSKS